jgi:hypothetical protein
MNNNQRLKANHANIIQPCNNNRITPFLKTLLTTLFFFTVIAFTSCKTCKCPAYSYHSAENVNADAIAKNLSVDLYQGLVKNTGTDYPVY